jgi:hypothetical protein
MSQYSSGILTSFGSTHHVPARYSHLLSSFRFAHLFGLLPLWTLIVESAGIDRLLLRKGGQTVYFGDIGQNATTLIEYLERNGSRKCEPDENPYVALHS